MPYLFQNGLILYLKIFFSKFLLNASAASKFLLKAKKKTQLDFVFTLRQYAII